MMPVVAKKTEIWVGLFILLSMVALLAMVIFMASERKLFAKRFEVRAVFADVQGLRAGAPVMLAGLQSGTVASIQFTPRGDLLVVMEIDRTYRDQIREDSVASIGTVGLLGDASVSISAGSRDYRLVAEGAILKTMPSVTFADILNRSQPLFDALTKTLSNLETITSMFDKTQEDLEVSLSEFRKALEKVNRGEGSLGRLLNDEALAVSLEGSLEEIRAFVAQMRSPQGTVGNLVYDRRLYDEALRAVEELGKASQTIREAAQGAIPLVRDGKKVVGRGEEIGEQMQRILQRADQIATQLEASSMRLPGVLEETGRFMEETRGAVAEARELVRAAQKHWLIRPYVSEPEPVTVVHEPR